MTDFGEPDRERVADTCNKVVGLAREQELDELHDSQDVEEPLADCKSDDEEVVLRLGIYFWARRACRAPTQRVCRTPGLLSQLLRCRAFCLLPISPFHFCLASPVKLPDLCRTMSAPSESVV